jgi:YspA, cpYpsA-related SLOG family
MKIIIAGGRDFNNYDLLKEKCNSILSKTKDIEIISGGAKGADSLGEKYALDNKYQLTIVRAEWDTLGKKAGIIRNEEMAKIADALICFWDGKSKGTCNMIEQAKKYNLPFRIINY